MPQHLQLPRAKVIVIDNKYENYMLRYSRMELKSLLSFGHYSL